jgi:hypothetical protein
MGQFDSEAALVAACRRHLDAAGIVAHEEVPCMARCIDMVIERSTGYIGIEYKLHNWKQALVQASDHLISLPYACVCMPPRRVTQEMRKAFTSKGVGLWFYRDAPWPFAEAIAARPSTGVWGVAAAWLERAISERKAAPAAMPQ